MAQARPSLLVPILLVIVVVAVAGVGAGLVYDHYHPAANGPLRTVAIGDNVTVNYIGLFANTPQVGRVFDTSIYSVATNNITYPKSLEFSLRGSPANYTPLPVHVGPSAPSGGYSLDGLTFGSVVTGFWQGLIGLPVNHTVRITFPASEGYGPQNSSCIVAQPLLIAVPVTQSYSRTAFAQQFPHVNDSAGTPFADPTYGWNDLVLSTNATAVVIERLPNVGWTVPAVGWPQVVTAINSTTITVSNQLTNASAGLVAGTVPSPGVCGETQYIVSAVDLADGTYSENYNHEVVGASLAFEVTVVQFY
jgi:FKBP-type peptidyl-prolyl cis-trans isomerase 2